MVYTVINSADILSIIALAIVVIFGIFGLVKGIYAMASPILVVILSLITGTVLAGKTDPIAGSKFLTFVIFTAAAGIVLTLLRKVLSKAADWFVIGWINHLIGLLAGLLIGYLAQAFIFGIINLIGGKLG